MGGEYNTRTYEGKLSREQVKKQVSATTEEMNYEDGNGSYSGHWGVKNGGVDFCSTTFNSEYEADTWLCDNNDKWGNVGACFFEEKMGTDTQNERIKTQRDKVRALPTMYDFNKSVIDKIKGGSAKTKGCKNCGNRVNVEHIHSISCPNCGTSWLTATELKKAEKVTAKIEAEQAKVDKLVAKRGGKTKKGWLVGGWCSC